MRFNLIPSRLNHDEAMDDIEALGECFDLDRGQIADLVTVEAAAGIRRNAFFEVGPDGVPWPELSLAYQAEKQRARPGKPMGVYDEIMLSTSQLVGSSVVTRYVIDQHYGDGNPVAMAHAIKFSEGGAATGTAQPPRPFYGFTVDAVAGIDGHFDDLFQSCPF